tara:strand:- start:103 stop:240 length:138 start_codon:yes stop_codon:yes gene_type:complete
MKNNICCLCKKKLKDKHDKHNAEPLSSGHCCSLCNIKKVIPERLK